MNEKHNFSNLKKLRDTVLDDFFVFASLIDDSISTGDRKIIHENPHRRVCLSMQNFDKNSLILLPRRFGKTYLATVFLIWYCFKYPNKNALLMADVKEKACNIIKSARILLKNNPVIKVLFGSNSLSKNGNDKTKLTIKKRKTSKKEPNILAYSMLQTPQAFRADIVIFEDILSHHYRTSPTIKTKTDGNFEAVIPVLEEHSKIIYIGTRYHHDDIPARIKKNRTLSANIDIIEESAEDEYGKSKYPNIISDEELSNIKSVISPSFYSSQYLNSPISPEEQLFNINEYHRYNTIPDITHFNSVYAGVDLAVANSNTSDDSAVVVVGKGRNGKLYILDCYGGKDRVDELYHRLKKLCMKWAVDKVFVESNNAFRIIYDRFVENSIRDNSNIYFEKLNNYKNKELRIETTLLPLFKNRILLLPSEEIYKSNPHLKKLIDKELTFFNPSIRNNKDDLLDALEIACSKFSDYHNQCEYRIGGELRTSSLDML